MTNDLEKKINELINELNFGDEITLEGVKEIILNEKDGNKEFNLGPQSESSRTRTASFAYLTSMFVSRVPDINRANDVAQIVSEAWSSLPHNSLGGLSPNQVIKKSKEPNRPES